MKTIRLWNMTTAGKNKPHLVPEPTPIQITLDDAAASICVRSGCAAASDADLAGLMVGGAIAPDGYVEVRIGHGISKQMRRIVVPTAAAQALIAGGYASISDKASVAGSGPSPSLNILLRAPVATDDTARGYSVGDSWLNQTSGTLYKATAVTAGAAVWAAQSAQPLPLDAVTIAGTAGYSLRAKIRAAYAGSALRIQRLSDSAFVDIGFVSGGATDSAAALTFIASKADTYRVVTVYDQSGNGFDATQPTFASAPIITAANITAYGIEADLTTGSFVIPTGYAVPAARDHTGVVLFRTKRAVSNDSLYEIGDGSSSSYPMARGAGSYYQGSLGSAGLTTGIEANRRQLMTFTSTASTRRVTVDDNARTGSSFNSAVAITGGRWGTAVYQTLAGYSFADDLILYPRSLTATEEAAVRASYYGSANEAPQYDRVGVFDGDSITQGYPHAQDWLVGRPGVYRLNAPLSTRVYNLGIQGQLLTQRVTAYSGTGGGKTYLRPGRKNVYYIWAGTNDIAGVTAATGATTYANLKAFCQTLIADGWTVITSTMMSRTDATGQKEIERQNYNTLILSGELQALGVRVVDNAAFDAAGHVTKVDGVHPDIPSYAAIAANEAPTIEAAFTS